MGYDWKRLEREDNERNDRAARSTGWTWVVIGTVGPAVGFLITGRYDWVSGLIWIGLGLVAAIPGSLALRKTRSPQRSEDTNRPAGEAGP